MLCLPKFEDTYAVYLSGDTLVMWPRTYLEDIEDLKVRKVYGNFCISRCPGIHTHRALDDHHRASVLESLPRTLREEGNGDGMLVRIEWCPWRLNHSQYHYRLAGEVDLGDICE